MAPSEPKTGQHVGGKYRVQQLLATGGMGFVYAARHEATGRSVAIKLLRPELAGRRDLVERVSREARLAVDASHPNVVEVLDAGADESGVPYVVLERLYGAPLEVLLNEPLELRATCEALVPVLNALVALHRIGIVHRDLKPSNIFLSLDERGRVRPKLLDFGIAKAVEGTGVTLTGTALGTPAYMAPEQLLGSSNASPASDVWAIAVVCVRCLTGRLPFADATTRGLALLRGGLGENELAGVPEPVARVLAAALAFEPRERFPSAFELRAALFSALAELGHREAWPNEASISFDVEESELARAVRAHLGSNGSSERAERRPAGRPRHLVTRTLSRVFESTAMRPAEWRASLGLAFIIGASVAVSWGERSENESESAREQVEDATPATVNAALLLEPRETLVRAAEPSEPALPVRHEPTATGAMPPPSELANLAPSLATPPEDAESRAPRREPSSEARPHVRGAPPAQRRRDDSGADRSSPAQPLPPTPLSPVPLAPTPAPDESVTTNEEGIAPALGANRSPIIE